MEIGSPTGKRVMLVRHARPVIAPDTAPEEWMLADGAASEVVRLAERMRGLGADGVVTSPEPKARGTAEIIAHSLALPVATDDAFREQGGGQVPFLTDEAFLATVAEHFRCPDEVVFGSETSAAAAHRFAAGIERARRRFAYPIVVTHGRVLCGYLATALGVDPVPIWRSLRLPDALVVDLDAREWARVGRENGQ